MRIGIFGAGRIGGVLAKKLSLAGHQVKLANSRSPETIAGLAETTGAKASSAGELAVNCEVVVIAIPMRNVPAVALPLKAASAEAIILDTTNYYPHRDGAIDAVNRGQTESGWVSEQLGRPVTKVWNAVLAGTLGDKGQLKGNPGRIAVPVSGDDVAGKKVAFELVDVTGFDPVDAGGLSDSWRHQPGSPAYCTELGAGELLSALSQVDRGLLARDRDLVHERRATIQGEITEATLLSIFRDVAGFDRES